MAPRSWSFDRFSLLLLCSVVLASFFPANGDFARIFTIVTDGAIGLLFFLHGARLSRDVVVTGFLHWRLQGVILITSFVVFPLLGLCFSFVPASILPPNLYHGLLFLCLLPSTVQSSIAFTSMAGGNVPAAICAASLSNIVGIFVTPILVGVLLSFQGQTEFSTDALEQILLQLLAPFVLGQILQPKIGAWIRARKTLLAPVDRGSILMVVYLAFSHAVTEGLWHMFSGINLAAVFLADISILIIVLCVTTWGSRFLGFNKADEITIVFCGSKKSLATGVPMASAIFAGQSLGAIVLPLMVFHQIQLMICAVMAQRYARAFLNMKKGAP